MTMAEAPELPLPLVDARELEADVRAVLRPGELVPDARGRLRRLPRFFYVLESWELANATQLVPNFSLAELMRVDVREAPPLRDFPRYVPCAVTLLAVHLQLLRQALGEPVYIAANGGYRSPGHGLSVHASPHCWGTAANLYRIGDTLLDERERIERYNTLILRHLPGVWVRPYGRGKGAADDHVHLDLGFVTAVPGEAPGEAPGEEAATER
jgi:hypothetical protein